MTAENRKGKMASLAVSLMLHTDPKECCETIKMTVIHFSPDLTKLS